MVAQFPVYGHKSDCATPAVNVPSVCGGKDMEEQPDTRGERRERRRKNRRKMRVTGSGARLLLDIARRRAEKTTNTKEA